MMAGRDVSVHWLGALRVGEEEPCCVEQPAGDGRGASVDVGQSLAGVAIKTGWLM
jgi:hypothetical protein